MLLTLKQKDQAILQNPSASFMVKSRRNNGGKGQNACLCSRDGREEEGEDGCSLLCCRLITIGSWLEPTVIDPNHCRSWLKPAVISTRQNTAGSSHKPAVMWSFTAGFSPAPIIFFIFKLITGSDGTSPPVVTIRQ